MTTSAAGPATGLVSRTASRKRRFIRLRCTAPPKARPTVNPTRNPEPVADGAVVTSVAMTLGLGRDK